jgi:2-amino-4-hydroxy-6-hydroxymethyldihydropteridine diphosphokinase
MQLDALPDLRVVGLSRWYSTAPVPPSGQPAYVNAVALLRSDAGVAEPDPAALLAWLQAIESDAGRSRSVPNAARTLDLDIIAMGSGGQMVRTAPDPVLPHPRMHLRAFVLAPLLDVAPHWLHPVLRRPARALLGALPPQEVAVLD